MAGYHLKTQVISPQWLTDALYANDGLSTNAFGSFGARKTRVDSITDAYTLVPLLFRGVRLRCNSLLNVPKHLYRGDTETKWPYPIDLDWLLWRCQAALLLAGGSVIVKLDTGRDLQWLNPFTVSVEWDGTSGTRIFKQSAQNVIGGTTRQWREDEVIFVRDFNPADDVGFGTPNALTALVSARVAFSINRVAAQFFENGAMPVTLVTTGSPIAEPERERIEGFFRKLTTGIRNFGRVLAISGDIKVETTQNKMKDLAMNDLFDQVRKDVARALELPVTLLDSDETFATAVEHRQQYYRDTVVPTAKMIATAFNRDLLEPLGLRMEFAPEEMDIFQTDETQRAASYAQYITTGMPPRIAAALLGIDVPQDVAAAWENYLKESEAPKPQAVPNAAQDANVSADTNAAEETDAPENATNAQNKAIERAQFRKVARKNAVKAAKFGFAHLNEREIAALYAEVKIAPAYNSDGHRALMQRFDAQVSQQEQKVRATVTALFEKQATDLKRRLTAHFKSATRKAETHDALAAYLADVQNANYEDAFAEAIVPVLREIVLAAGEAAITDYALAIAFDVLDANVTKFLAARSQRFARQVNETTWNALKASLMDGLQNGESIPQLAARVESVMQGRITSNGETIARTEVISASNFGTLDSWRQSGVVGGKTWLATLDDRVREWHADAHGQTVALDEAFTVDGEELLYPGDESGSAENIINCRCTMTAVLN